MSIKKQVPRIESTILQYYVEPLPCVQSRGVVRSFVNAAFTEFTSQELQQQQLH
jgi:hypothetical protein